MNYPLQSLAIIGPLLFILLMIAIPCIGFLGGWKRAAYWGGGNFIFYGIGIGLWAGLHNPIGKMIAGLVEKLSNGVLNASQVMHLGASLAAPVFFMIYMFLVNGILTLVYYLWFKKWAKLRKQDMEGAKKPNFQARMVNGAIGAVALPVLLLPSTFTFTQGVMFMTTSRATRANNKLARNLYNGLVKVSDDFNWFSYYGITDSARDYDAVFSALNMLNKKISFGGEEVTVIEALKDTIQGGFDEIFEGLQDYDPENPKLEDAETIVNAVNQTIDQWNEIMGQAGNDVVSLFTSNTATDAITGILGLEEGDIGNIETIDEFLETYGPEGAFQDALDAYEKGKWEFEGEEPLIFHAIDPINVSSQAYNNLVDTMKNFYQLSDEIKNDDECMELFDERINELVSLLVNKK